MKQRGKEEWKNGRLDGWMNGLLEEWEVLTTV